jgi:hypothetical protein
MAEPTLEDRVAALEQAVAELRGSPAKPPANGKWWEQVGPAFRNDPAFEEMLAYGRYFRKTGQEPPPDWKPGDPIPESSESQASPDSARPIIVFEPRSGAGG